MKKCFLLFLLAWSCCKIQAQLFKIDPGTSWKTDNTTYVVLNNTDFQYNAATALLSNVFKFTGTAGSSIYGNALPIFRSIQLAKTGTGKLILQRDINLSQEIDFQGGNFDLNGFVINMGANALLNNENENSRIMGNNGYVRIINDLNAPNAANPGNLGAVITSAQNLGSTTIFRGVTSQINGSGNGNSILRYYDIIPTNNTSLNATLRFNYFDTELNSLPENSLVIWKSDNGTNWSMQGYTNRDAAANYVEKSGITDFSRWTLSSLSNPLPVNFILFNLHCNANSVVLTWKTVQEQNTSHFEIEKSNDGYQFSVIGTITAVGNSGVEKSYSFTDYTVSSGNNYYRIKEVDADGRSFYTNINKLQCGEIDEKIKLWPNPVEQVFTVQIFSHIKTDAAIRLYDEKGRFVYAKNVALLSGSNNIWVDIGYLPAGAYWLHISLNDNLEKKSVKIIKR